MPAVGQGVSANRNRIMIGDIEVVDHSPSSKRRTYSVTADGIIYNNVQVKDFIAASKRCKNIRGALAHYDKCLACRVHKAIRGFRKEIKSGDLINKPAGPSGEFL